jgi:hypothetical protein
MARISTYPTDNNITPQDKVLGTDEIGFATKNYTFEGIVNWFNASGAIHINGQNNYMFQEFPPETGRSQGTISFTNFGGSSTPFSNITTFKLAEEAVTKYTLEDYLPTMIGKQIMLVQTNDANSFGIYVLENLERDIEEPAFFNATVSFIRGNGVILAGRFYGLSLYVGDSDKTFVFTQNTAENPWIINHNLNKFPSVSMVLSTGQVGIADVTYIDQNNLTITFSGDESGKAYMN